MRVAKRSLAFNRLYNYKYLNNYLQIFIQLLIKRGRKLQAEKIIFKFFSFLKKKFKYLKLERFFNKIFKIYEPKIAFVYRKVAAIIYSLPSYISFLRAKILVVRQFFLSVNERLEFGFYNKMIAEQNDFIMKYGKTIKRIENFQELAKKNKPFLKFLRKQRGSFSVRLKKYGIKNKKKNY